MSVETGSTMRICEVGSARVPFVEHGEPVYGQAPLFLFGGKGTDATSWKGLPAALGRHVIAVETPKGYYHPMWPTVEGFAAIMGGAALKLTEDWYGPKTKPDIGGWSLGGMFALAFGLQSPDRIRKSVLMASPPGGITAELGPLTGENMAAAIAIANPYRYAFDPGSVYGGAMRRNSALAAEFKDLTHRQQDPIRGWREMCAALGSCTLHRPTMEGADDERAQNTLAMFGGDDPVIPRDAAVRLAERAGMHTFVAEDEGHLFPIDWPGTADVVNLFLDEGVVPVADNRVLT